ncbi:MAG: Ser-Thr-rich GPI-anchored membrane family protein [Acidobacteriota bacterium]
MKKKLILLFSVILLSGLIYSGTLTVTSPGPGTAWYKGDGVTISWTSAGCTDPEIKINIFRNSIDPANFVEQLTCTGCSSKGWTVPAGYTNGNYVIRVKTADGTCRGDSSVFTIGERFVSTGTITVENFVGSPFPLTQWALSISWGSTGTVHENVSIEAIPEGNPAGAMIIVAGTPNDDFYEWRNPGDLTGAGRFFIRVKTSDGAVWGDSRIFEILPPPAPFVQISVTGPGEGGNWNVGSPRMIYWRKDGPMAENVKIELLNHTGSALIRTITANTANDGSEHWVVPRDHAAGRYIMRVKTVDNEVTGDSGIFNITRPDDPATDPRTRADPDETPPDDRDPRTPILPERVIKIKFPDKNSIWKRGKNVEIIWSKGPATAARVRIELWKTGSLQTSGTISERAANNGKFKWKVPNIVSGGKFIVKIKEIGGIGHYGISDVFIIKGKSLRP